MEAILPTAAGFLLVLMRCAGMCMVAPLFGTRAIPQKIRLGVALALAFTAFTAAGAPAFAAWTNTTSLLMAAVSETIIGLAAGLAAMFCIEAASAAGHAIGVAMGLGFGATVDPFNGAESTALAELIAFITLGVAVAAGLHRDAVLWLCRSVIETPPGAQVSIAELAASVVGAGANAAALAIRLTFPVMVAVTFGHIGLGVMNRAAPQLNLSNIGFSVAILAGGGALYLIAPGIAEIASNAARTAFVGR